MPDRLSKRPANRVDHVFLAVFSQFKSNGYLIWKAILVSLKAILRGENSWEFWEYKSPREFVSPIENNYSMTTLIIKTIHKSFQSEMLKFLNYPFFKFALTCIWLNKYSRFFVTLAKVKCQTLDCDYTTKVLYKRPYELKTFFIRQYKIDLIKYNFQFLNCGYGYLESTWIKLSNNFRIPF